MSEKFEPQKLFTHPEEKTSPKGSADPDLYLFSFYLCDSRIRSYGTYPIASHLTSRKIQYRFHFIPIIIVHHRMQKSVQKLKEKCRKIYLSKNHLKLSCRLKP